MPPAVRVEVAGGVRADGGGHEPGVVGAQGVLDEREGVRAEVFEMGQREEDGPALGGRPACVEAGERGHAGAGRVEEQDAGGVGEFGVMAAAAVAGRGGEVRAPSGEWPRPR